MKILIVSPYLPYPTDRGDYIRTFNLIKQLSKRNEIDLISLDDFLTKQQGVTELKKYCNKINAIPLKRYSKAFQLPKLVARLSRFEPFINKYWESKDLQKLLYKTTSKKKYDIIQFEHSYVAGNLKFLNPKHNPKTILIMQNITFLQYYRIYNREKNIYKKIKYFLTWFPMLDWEPKMARCFDKVIVVSGRDRILLQSLEPSLDVSIAPNGVDTEAYKPYPLEGREKNLLIVGSMDYRPNLDATKYFYNEIFPLIKKTFPDCTLTIVGKNPPAELLKLDADSSVKVMGNVDDVRPYYKRALVSVVSLRSGGGTRLKILESMALGTPVVSTSLGCEGLDVKNGSNILIADDPKDFAQNIYELFMYPTLWDEISRNARHLVEKKYDWACIARHLQSIYEEIVPGSENYGCSYF